MSKIQDDNKLYSFLRPYVDYHVRKAFRRYKVVGYDKIPQNAACIFGANHTNTLMDALVLLCMNHEKKVFIARGDIFKKPTIAKIMFFLRILPIYRIRDGFKSVKDNNAEIIDKAADVVHDGVKLFLYPEAAHRTKHSLRQLSKGIFHIALKANNDFGHEKPVYLVPTGIEYGDYFRYRSTALITFGEPINVTEYVNNHKDENEAVILNNLREMFTERLSSLISFIPDNEENYEAIWEMTKIKSGLKGSLEERRDRNQKVIKEILEWKEKYSKDFTLFKTQDLIDQGYFGKGDKGELLGDFIAIGTYTHKTLIFHENSNYFKGHHTGLTEEMKVPLIIINN